ncbi:MAG: RagB/SusD family nutrient uptake outer membrane protein [Bacteroidales bacterium]|nr:RagB/SusD family nutrient uptake outer membrane protein [Bacteroidales bacterium]
MKKYSLYIGLAGLMLAAASCSDPLNELPTQSKVDGNLIVDQKTAQIALNGVYYQFAMCKVDNYDVESTGVATYYEALPADFAGVLGYYQGDYMLETHPGYYSSVYNLYIWQPLYKTVVAANAVIDQLEGANDAWFTTVSKSSIVAEARLMRAIAYTKLFEWFGYYWDQSSPYGLIIRDEAVTASNMPCGRSTVSESYDFILADLDYAIQNAPDVNPNHYTNKWVAKGQKARVLMMKGDYQGAADLCADIISNSPYTLEERQTDIFHVKGLASKEVMFGIQPKERQTANYEEYYYRGSAQWLPTKNFATLYQDDPRMDTNFLHTVDSTLYLLYLAYLGLDMPELIVDSYIVCKHLDPTVLDADDIEETNVEMRLTEFYLMRAEALAQMGYNTESIALLKTVLEHAGYTDFSTTADLAVDQHSLLEQIFNEYLRNLFCENGRELSLMMRMPADIVLAFNYNYADESGTAINKQYSVLGIPADEFSYNTALSTSDQNPGYATSN